MDVVLHTGAHRTASTTFQHYIRENAAVLQRSNITIMDPRQTRDGFLTGVIPVHGNGDGAQQFERAKARVALHLSKTSVSGTETLLISDENMTGAPRRNLRQAALYPDIGERMSRFSIVFGGQITRIVFAIRSQDSYWSSVLAYAVGRGYKIPTEDNLERLTSARRMWRDVITDLACAMPGTEICVLPYEVYGGLPERVLELSTGHSDVPRAYAREWLNRAPSLNQLRKAVEARGDDPSCLPEGVGRWLPFSADQARRMRETYADDLFWLRAGADGLARLIEETEPMKTGKISRIAQMKRGQENGIENRRLA